MLLARTLRSSTFRLALLYITIFGAATLLLFWYVYSATTSYVRDRLDHELTRELGALQSAYHKGGRDGVSRAIADRLAGRDNADTFYLLTDDSLATCRVCRRTPNATRSGRTWSPTAAGRRCGPNAPRYPTAAGCWWG